GRGMGGIIRRSLNDRLQDFAEYADYCGRPAPGNGCGTGGLPGCGSVAVCGASGADSAGAGGACSDGWADGSGADSGSAASGSEPGAGVVSIGVASTGGGVTLPMRARMMCSRLRSRPLG